MTNFPATVRTVGGVGSRRSRRLGTAIIRGPPGSRHPSCWTGAMHVDEPVGDPSPPKSPLGVLQLLFLQSFRVSTVDSSPIAPDPQSVHRSGPSTRNRGFLNAGFRLDSFEHAVLEFPRLAIRHQEERYEHHQNIAFEALYFLDPDARTEWITRCAFSRMTATRPCEFPPDNR